MEDARKDVRFTASSWKTWIQREEKFISSLFPASSVFHKTTARSSVLARLPRVFPENTCRGSAVAAPGAALRSRFPVTLLVASATGSTKSAWL